MKLLEDYLFVMSVLDEPVPRVMRVEYCQRDRIVGGAWREWTEADVMTPMGEIHVNLPGYHAERSCYPALLDAGMDLAWRNFVTAGDWQLVSGA